MFWLLAVFAADSEQQVGSLPQGVPTLKKNKLCPDGASPPTQKPLHKSAVSVSLQHPHPDHPSIPIEKSTHLWLTVVLQRHGDDIDTDDKGDDQVQVVAGTQSVDSQPGWTVWRIVRQLLGLWREKK